jgi:hypothetical protein
VTIDGLLRSGCIPPPDFIKIDVEGAEALVLAGAAEALAAYHPAIFLAIHGNNQRTQCLTHLRHLGYDSHPLKGSSLVDGDEFFAIHAGAENP